MLVSCSSFIISIQVRPCFVDWSDVYGGVSRLKVLDECVRSLRPFEGGAFFIMTADYFKSPMTLCRGLDSTSQMLQFASLNQGRVDSQSS